MTPQSTPTDPSVSVVVVSRKRPDALLLCLTGCQQLQYDRFEIVVVADPGSIARIKALPIAANLKLVTFDEANISEARNRGANAAAGEIIAFVDDDAIPEPTWLSHLTAPFADQDIAAAGGFVRGRNGISFQWQGRTLDGMGEPQPMEITGDTPVVVRPSPGRVAKTEGTNMAVRRKVLVSLGGFDPAYHYFLDETDLNMRLGAAGYATAIVPLAQVHHGYAASKRRRSDRVPTDLFDVGASWAVFQRKFVPQNARRQHWRGVRASEFKRAVSLMVSGHIEPHMVGHLMARLDLGYGQGIARRKGAGFVSVEPEEAFQQVPRLDGERVYLSCRPWQRRAMRDAALKKVKNGAIVTLLVLSPTSVYHHAGFSRDGYWEQSGGLFGKSERSQRLVSLWTFVKRAAFEVARIGKVRNNLANSP